MPQMNQHGERHTGPTRELRSHADTGFMPCRVTIDVNEGDAGGIEERQQLFILPITAPDDRKTSGPGRVILTALQELQKGDGLPRVDTRGFGAPRVAHRSSLGFRFGRCAVLGPGASERSEGY